MSTNPIPVVFVPYQKYSRKELNHQLGLSIADTQLLTLMHQLDRGDARACFARNSYLAEELGTTEGAVRSRVTRLRQQGYIVTLGYDLHGIAYRRVVLKYGVKADARGAYTDTVVNGRIHRKKRKTGEANPIIFLREARAGGLTNMRVPPSHIGERQSVNESKNKNTPISSAGPAGPAEDSPASFYSFQPDSVVEAADTPDSRQETVASDNTAPVTSEPANTTPATLADLDRNPGSRGKPWQELANQQPGFLAICRRFGVTNPDRATARAFMKRIQHHGQTFNTVAIKFVLEHLDDLKSVPESGIPVPQAMGDFMRDFRVIANCLLRLKRTSVRETLQQQVDSFSPGFSPLESAEQFRALQAKHGFTTFAEFHAFCEETPIGIDGFKHRSLLWLAALTFVTQGDQSVLENPDAQNEITQQIIMTPELVNNLPPALETATGHSATLLVGMRTAVLSELEVCLSVFAEEPTVERTLVLHYELPGFIREQIEAYAATQTVRDLVGELHGIAA